MAIKNATFVAFFVRVDRLKSQRRQQLPDDGDQRDQKRNGADDDGDGGAAVAFGEAVLQVLDFFAVALDFAAHACLAFFGGALCALLCAAQLALKGVNAAGDFGGINVGDGKRDLCLRRGRYGSGGDVGRGDDAEFAVIYRRGSTHRRDGRRGNGLRCGRGLVYGLRRRGNTDAVAQRGEQVV